MWNVRLNGKRLGEIKDPGKTWVAMDFVGVHDYMVTNRYCGHLGKVNILYADGTVRLGEPPLYQFRRKTKEKTYWIDWAKQ